MKVFKTFSIIAFSLSISSVFSQSKTLDECLQMAMKNNPQTRLVELEQKMPDLKIQELKKFFLPRLTLNGDYKFYYQMPQQLIPAAAFGGPPGVYNTVTFGVPHNIGLGLQASQMILNKPLSYNIEKVRQSAKLSEVQLIKIKEDLVYNISTIYLNAQQLLLQKSFLKENSENLEQLIKMTQNLKDAQMAKGTDVEQLQLNKKIIDNQDTQLEIAYNQLINTLGFLLNTEESIRITTFNKENFKVDTNTTKSSSASVLLIEEQKKLAQMDLNGYKLELYPTISAYAQQNYSGFGKTGTDKVFKIIPTGLVGLQLNFALYDWGLYNVKKNQKMIEFEKFDTQVEMLQLSQRNDLKNARLKIKSIQNMILLEQENIDLAKKLLEKAKIQLKEGVINVSEVINRENVLIQSQSNYSKQFIDLSLAILDYKKANNSLLK